MVHKIYPCTFWVLIGLVMVTGVGGIVARKSLQGFYMYKLAKWEEDAFKGKPVSKLQRFLQGKNLALAEESYGLYYALTGEELQSNQRLMVFNKGESYLEPVPKAPLPALGRARISP
jgi:hypothetical protein